MIVAVRVEDQWSLPELLLQAIGVKLGLLLSDSRIATGALGLDERQRLAVITPQDVIHKALAFVVGHPRDFELAVARLVKRPARLLQKQVDEVVACCRFRVIVRIRLGGGSLLRIGHLGAESHQLLVQGRLVSQQHRELLVPFAQARFHLLQLVDRLLGDRGGSRKRVWVEG
ncbi:MAG: hypothetical protein M0000_05355 [Actinomycetota bacterium]|nr:hypothetical protein [Actinomycetota bacterium]